MLSGHGFELLSKMKILKQRILTYSKQPSVQYYLEPGNPHTLADLRSELAQLVQMQADIERNISEDRGVADSNDIVGGNKRCVETIRKYMSAGGSVSVDEELLFLYC